jgi:hypothetical protein
MNINKLKSTLSSPFMSNGVALPCHYICNILPGAGLYQNNIFTKLLGKPLGGMAGTKLINSASRQVSLLAESVELPGRSFLTTEQKLYGTVRKMPYGVQYEDINISFICTNNMTERTFFNSWHQFIMNTETQYMEYYKDYVGQIKIIKINNDKEDSTSGDATKMMIESLNTYTLHDAYPISISSQDLSYSDDDSYLKLTVTFTYSKWSCGVDSISSIVDNLI